MKKCVLAYLLMMALSGVIVGQSGDVIGMHDLSSGGQTTNGPGGILTSPKGSLSACQFCHAPHSGTANTGGLWSQQLSPPTTYTLNTSSQNQGLQPAIGGSSSLCLSCHDGTVALGQTTPYGDVNPKKITFDDSKDKLGTDLSSVHPFNLTLPLHQTTPTSLYDSVVNGTGTANPAVKLIDKNVQCTSCHDPHYQSIDKASNFLVMDNTGSALCQACHSTVPGAVLTMPLRRTFRVGPKNGEAGNSQPQKSPSGSSLGLWRLSAHAVASHRVGKGARVGNYGAVGRNGCLSCHSTHNGMGGKALLSVSSPVANMDAATQNCITCHNGSSVITPSLPNVFAEFAKIGHPLPSATNKHVQGEIAVLDNNRHATCVDCHNPHASQKSDSFALTTIRKAQSGVIGVSAGDGTVVSPALNQYENCLRCHGTSTGKQTLAQFGYEPVWAVSSGDPFNVISQFSTTSSSAHPVMRDRNSSLPQPSLLQNIWNLDGRVQGRLIGPRILCTDCHNSDDNREFGGSGPNGPHGSQYPHILERRYEMSQVTPLPGGGPGSTIQNLFPNPVLDPACGSYPCASPYALCAKCHDLQKVVSNSSFSEHARHINDGFSCSTCHTSHGLGATSASVSGERMVDFDANVVGSKGGAAISYNRATNSCSLVCHGHAHALRTGGAVPAVSAISKK